MEKKILNYRIIIEKEKNENGLPVYVAYCPTLGISDFGSTVELAKENMEEAIDCHIQGIIKTGDKVPAPDIKDSYISLTEIMVPKNIKLAY